MVFTKKNNKIGRAENSSPIKRGVSFSENVMRIIRRIVNTSLDFNFFYELKYDNGYNWYYIGFGWEIMNIYPILYVDLDRLNNGSVRGLFMIPFREGDLDENNL